MIRNVLKPDGTAHIEQQVGNMRYDLTTGQVDTVVPGAGATNLVFGVDGKLPAVRQMDQDVAGVLEGPHFVFQTEARCGLGDRQLELSGGRDVVHDAAG